MAGTRQGGLAAAKKNLKRDPEFYANIGRIGGKNGRKGGFASTAVGKDGLTGRERARKVGMVGGRMSRRGKAED